MSQKFGGYQNRIDLLPEGKSYKACLHTHTTVSDGKYLPEEVKKLYQERGYSVVAFSDHEVLVPHGDLTDENFVALTAYELSINEKRVERLYPYEKCYHFNCFSKEPNKDVSPVFTEKEIWLERSKQYVSEAQRKVDYPLCYNKEMVNEMIRRLNEDGFLVSYNHPVWSGSDKEDYDFIDGLWGVEVYNNDCAFGGYPDTVRPWEELLKQGKNVFPLATDDMHSEKTAFGGFVMLKMSLLSYENVIKAMKNGDFYASEGPLIYSLILNGTTLRITCSPCNSIMVNTQMRACQRKNGKDITEAEFDVKKYFDLYEDAKKNEGQETYFRISITDEAGRSAYTKAFFIKDIINQKQA